MEKVNSVKWTECTEAGLAHFVLGNLNDRVKAEQTRKETEAVQNGDLLNKKSSIAFEMRLKLLKVVNCACESVPGLPFVQFFFRILAV